MVLLHPSLGGSIDIFSGALGEISGNSDALSQVSCLKSCYSLQDIHN